MSEYIKRQHDLRQAAWHEAKHILDTAGAENRDLTAEEQEKYDRISADLDTRAQVIEQLKADEERAARLDAVAAEIRTDEAPAGEDEDAEAIRKLARGEIRSFDFQKRDMLTTSTGSSSDVSGSWRIRFSTRRSSAWVGSGSGAVGGWPRCLVLRSPRSASTGGGQLAGGC